MTPQATLISNHQFQTHERFLLDANVWLLLYGPQGDPASYGTKVYSKALKGILTARSTICLDVLIMSEFINAYARLEHQLAIRAGFAGTFKEFRKSTEFPQVAQRIAADARQVLNLCQPIESGFSTIDVSALLSEYEKGQSDFNDEVLADICATNDLILVTNDADFKPTGLRILTGNKRLLQ